jgi:2-polyprenyl-3-methyl-5-hydroxy-6-metoxy-1,4-benzoquinol methylase
LCEKQIKMAEKGKSKQKMSEIHELRFNREIERLRDPQRVARLEIKRVVDLALENLKGLQTVLDVGTGSGLFAEEFAAAPRGLQVTGLDANPEMLPVAQQFAPSGTFRIGETEHCLFQMDPLTWCLWDCCCMKPTTPWQLLGKRFGWFSNDW